MHKSIEVQQKTAFECFCIYKEFSRKGVVIQEHGHVLIYTYSDARYIGDRGDMKSASGCLTFINGNLVTWRSKKQDIVSRVSAEVEYRVMAYTTYELQWVKNLMTQFGFKAEEFYVHALL